MAKVRKYRLSDTSQDVDLCQYEDEIVQTINDTVPGKHPKVYPDYFTTDPLSQSEAVKIGRALSKSYNLQKYGKIITTFRLFSGRTVEVEEPEVEEPVKTKSGRMR